MLRLEVAGLPNEIETDDIESRMFDLTALRMQLALAEGNETVFESHRQLVVEIAMLLEEKSTIPAVKTQLGYLASVQETDFWEGIVLSDLEELRLRLRGIVPFLDKKKRKIVYTDFQDEVMGVREEPALYMPKMTGAQYEKKVKEYLRNHLDHLVVRRLRTNQPLTDADLKGLESILVEKHATSSVADKRDVQPLDAVAPPRAGGADRNRRGLPRRVMPSLPIPTKSSTHSERSRPPVPGQAVHRFRSNPDGFARSG